MALFDKSSKLGPEHINKWVEVVNKINSKHESGSNVTETYINGIIQTSLEAHYAGKKVGDKLKLIGKSPMKLGTVVTVTLEEDFPNGITHVQHDDVDYTLVGKDSQPLTNLQYGETLLINMQLDGTSICLNIKGGNNISIEDIKGLQFQIGGKIISSNLTDNPKPTNNSSLEMMIQDGENVDVLIKVHIDAKDSTVKATSIMYLNIDLKNNVVKEHIERHQLSHTYNYGINITNENNEHKLKLTISGDVDILTDFEVSSLSTITNIKKTNTILTPTTNTPTVLQTNNAKDLHDPHYSFVSGIKGNVSKEAFKNSLDSSSTTITNHSEILEDNTAAKLKFTLPNNVEIHKKRRISSSQFGDYGPYFEYKDDNGITRLMYEVGFDENEFKSSQGMPEGKTFKDLYELMVAKRTAMEDTINNISGKQKIKETRQVKVPNLTEVEINSTDHENEIVNLSSVNNVFHLKDKDYGMLFKQLTGFSGIHNPVFINNSEISNRLARGDESNLDKKYNPFQNDTWLSTLVFNQGKMSYLPHDTGLSGKSLTKAKQYKKDMNTSAPQGQDFNKSLIHHEMSDGHLTSDGYKETNIISKQYGMNIYKAHIVEKVLHVVTDGGAHVVYDIKHKLPKETAIQEKIVDVFPKTFREYDLVLVITKDNKLKGYGENVGNVFKTVDATKLSWTEITGISGTIVDINYSIPDVVLVHTITDGGNGLIVNKVFSFGELKGVASSNGEDVLYSVFGDRSGDAIEIYTSTTKGKANMHVNLTYREVVENGTTYHSDLITIFMGNGGETKIFGTYHDTANVFVEKGGGALPSTINLGYKLTTDFSYGNFLDSLPKDFNSNLYFLQKGRVYYKDKANKYIWLNTLPEISHIVRATDSYKQRAIVVKSIFNTFFIIKDKKSLELNLPNGSNISRLYYSVEDENINVVMENVIGEIFYMKSSINQLFKSRTPNIIKPRYISYGVNTTNDPTDFPADNTLSREVNNNNNVLPYATN